MRTRLSYPQHVYRFHVGLRSLAIIILIAGFGAATMAQSDSNEKLGYGRNVLPTIPPSISKNNTSPRTVELLGKAMYAAQGTDRAQLVKEIGRCQLSIGLIYLKNAMTDPDPQVRAAAAMAAEEIADPGILPQLKMLMADQDPDVRRQALLAGAALGDPSYALDGLADKNTDVQIAAIRFASTPGHAATIANQLPDMPPALQIEAIHALQRLRATLHAGAIAPFLNGTPVQKIAALKAVREMSATTLFDAVYGLRNDPYPTIRREMLEALGVIASVEIQRTAAIAALADSDFTVRAAAVNLLKANPTPQGIELLAGQLDIAYPPLHEAARDALVATQAAVIPTAIELLNHPDPRRREDGSYILGKLKSDQELVRHIQLLEDPDWKLVEQVAYSLGEIHNSQAAKPLAKLASRAATITKEDKAGISACAEAIIACGKLGYKPILNQITPVIPGSGYSPALRSAAIWTFGMLGDPSDKTSKSLIRIYMDPLGGEPRIVISEAIKALGNLQYEAAADDLGNFMHSSDTSEIRWIASWAYNRINGSNDPYVPIVRVWSAEVSISDLSR